MQSQKIISMQKTSNRTILIITGVAACVSYLVLIHNLQPTIYDLTSNVSFPKFSATSEQLGKSKARPWTRVALLYIPKATPESFKIMREAYSFVSSWRAVYNIQQNYVDYDLEDALNDKLVENHLYLPWYQNYSRAVRNLNLSSDIQILSVNSESSLIPPDGPPLITDVLLVTDPSNLEDEWMPRECQALPIPVLQSLGIDKEILLETLNLTQRLLEAHEKLVSTSKPIDVRNEALIGESRCFFIRASLPSTHIQIFERHPNIHSIGALAAPEIRILLQQYDLVIRTDADCFLTPFFNDPKAIPWHIQSKEKPSVEQLRNTKRNSPNTRAFMTGKGGYSGEEQNQILKEYLSFLGMRHQNVHSVGSTWYGDPKDIVLLADIAVAAAEFLLRHDGLFSLPSGHGIWPLWYRGVTSMYAGEIAVNHLIDAERLFLTSILDGGVGTNTSLIGDPKAHLHCWHGSEFFDKFKTYPHELVLGEGVRIDQPSWYALVFSTAGSIILKARRSMIRAKSGNSLGPVMNLLLDKPHIVDLYKKYATCPKDSYPYLYLSGLACCKHPVDCLGLSLNASSECCKDNDYKLCQGTCVIDVAVPPNVDKIKTSMRAYLFTEQKARL